MKVQSGGRRLIPRPWYAGAVGFGCVLVLNLSLGLCLAPESLAAVGAVPVVSGASAATDAALRERVARDGWVKVQVDLPASATAAAPLDPIQTALDQADLDQAVKDLLFALPPGSYDSLLHVPGSARLTLRVDAAGLDELLASPLAAAVVLAGDADMQRIAAGGQDSLVIKPDGILWAWGWNAYGQLGDGTTADRWSPGPVLTGVAAVANAKGHSLVIKTDGSLWAWGVNWHGQLGDGTGADRVSPIQVLTGVAAVANSAEHVLALKTDASVWAWGWNTYGQLGDGTTTDRFSPVQVLTGVAAVAAGNTHSLAIKSDGSLWAWGNNGEGQLGDGTIERRLNPVQVLAGVAAVAAGADHTLALKTDGSLWAWGANWQGELGDGTNTGRRSPVQVLTGVAAVAGGSFSYTLAIKTDHSLWAWGANGQGQLGDGTTTERWSPVPVLTGVAAVAASENTLALKTDGTVWAWGSNWYGQLGDGTTTNRWSPIQVPGFGAPATQPDFVVTSLVPTPTNATANGTFGATVTVKNQGAGAGTPGMLQVWVDQGGAQYCGALGDKSATLTSLAAGASQTVTLSGLPTGAAGAKTLRAFVDSQCLTAESDETNNQAATAYTVTAPLPDFVVTSVALTPGSPAANGTFSVAVTVVNKGAASGSGGWLDVWADRSAAPTCGMAGNVFASIGTLAAGAGKTLILSGVPAGAPGPKTLRAFVDSFCQTTEIYEDNNQSATAYTVAAGGGGPDFVVTNVVLTPSSPQANTTFSAAVTVMNQGAASGAGGWLDVWANQPTAPACWSAGNVYTSVGTLAAGAAKTFSFSGLRAGTVGTKTLRAFVDSFCGTSESNEGNNQALQSYSVSP